MIPIKVETLLFIHVILVGGILMFWGIKLSKNHLFIWTSTGFWAWVSFTLYFVMAPVVSIINRDIHVYEERLIIAGGVNRLLWIMAIIVFGITVFYIVYLRTTPRPVQWRLVPDNGKLTVPQTFVLIFILLVAFISLLTYRSLLIPGMQDVVIVGGRFLGTTTGYEYSTHMFFFIPVAYLMISENRLLKLFGWSLGLLYIWFSLPFGWSRFTTLSMLILMSLADTYLRKRKFPRILLITGIILTGMILQIRGHTDWTLQNLSDEVRNLTLTIPVNVLGIIGSADTSMLPSFYLESYIKDTLTGYDYGIPLVNYFLTGWIPGRILPEKYFLLDWLRSLQSSISSPTIYNLIYGSKPSLLGSFYSNGGAIAVFLLMGLAGYLSKKVDGMLLPESHNLLKAIGIAFISTLWMIWGSHDYWGITILGVIFIPGLLLWFVSPKVKRKIVTGNNLKINQTQKPEKFIA